MFAKFDVIITEFPFIDNKKKSKIRPAVIVSSEGYNQNTGFVIIAMVTTAKHSKMWNDIEIKDIQSIQLKEPSIVRMKFANIQESDILAKIGTLDIKNQKTLEENIKVVFGV